MKGNIVRQFDNRRPLTRVFLGKQEDLKNKENLKSYIALIDTGANSSVVADEVAMELNLIPIGTVKTISTSHIEIKSPAYDILIGVSVNEKPKIELQNGIFIATGQQGDIIPILAKVSTSPTLIKQGIHMLLGMDIISLGHLSITKDSFILSIGT